MDRYQEIARKVRILVGDNQTEKAIEFLLEEQTSQFETTLRNLESRYKRTTKANLSGTIDHNSFSIELNKINDSLLHLANEIENYPNKIQTIEKKKSYKKRSAIAFIVLISICLTTGWIISFNKEKKKKNAEIACAKKWENCLKSGDITTYQQFIKSPNCTNDSLINIANDSIDVITMQKAWLLAKNTNKFEAYVAFFSKYPNFNISPSDAEQLKLIVEGRFNTYYRFDGNTQDAVGENNGKGFHATIEDNYNVDRFDRDKKAYMFNRSKFFDSERIEVPTLIKDSLKTYSISLWVKFTRESDGGVLFGQYQEKKWWKHHARYNHKITLNPNSVKLDEFLPSGQELNQELSTPLTIGQWHHIVITRGPQSAYFYLDGELIDASDYDETYTGKEDTGKIKTAFIGGTIRDGKLISSFRGRIDDLGFLSATLTEEEVQFIYNVQKVN